MSTPRLANRFLKWFCKPQWVHEIQGDLEEEFHSDTAAPWVRQIKYWFKVFGFFRPYFLKNPFAIANPMGMTINNLTMAFRLMRKKPLFTSINVVGLSAGLACTLVIAAYVQFMLSYDRQYAQAEDLFRITMRWMDDGVESHSARAVPPVSQAIEGKLSGLEAVVKVFPISGLVSKDGLEKTREHNFAMADSLFFELFTFPALHGNLATALDAPFSVVLTQPMAIKYFGKTEVVGEEILLETDRGTHRFHVTAVLKPLPQNIHFNPEFIASFSSMERMMPWYNNWHYPPMYVYVKKNPMQSAAELEAEVHQAIVGAHPDYIKKNERSYFLQPVIEIHLHSNLTSEWQANSNFAYVQTLSLIALFILVLAAINYVNLASARGAERAKEVGVRKVMGAFRLQLVRQFLSESLLTTLVSLPLALLFAEGIIRFFLNGLLAKDLSLFEVFSPWHAAAGFALVLFIALVAGFYPALVLSQFRPAAVLKGKNGMRGGLSFRRVMVTFQFVVSCLLMVGMLVIQRQVSFMRTKELGFGQQQLVAVKLFGQDLAKNYGTFKNELLTDTHVEQVAVASTLPFQGNFYGWNVTPEGFTAEDGLTIKGLSGDEDILKTLDLTLVTGRDFEKGNPADAESGFILNEAAVRMLNWKEPLHKNFELTFYTQGPVTRKGKVIGVVQDFHFESLYSTIEPLVIFVNTHSHYCDYVLVKLAQGNLAESLPALETHWKKFSPAKPFEFLLADNDMNNLFAEETKLSKMFNSFTLLSILISSLGLFGLSAFSMGQRVKEIGIRKVLGASSTGLFSLLTKEYLLLTLIAQALAAPLAWWLAHRWLEGFAYRTEVQWYVFAISLAMGLLLGILSISFHIIKATLDNPIKALRSE